MLRYIPILMLAVAAVAEGHREEEHTSRIPKLILAEAAHHHHDGLILAS
jgi:hypothetical protein